MLRSKSVQLTVAVASFIAAVALAFTALFITVGHEIAAGVCMVIAQFLLLTASIFGIDYKFSQPGSVSGIKKSG